MPGDHQQIARVNADRETWIAFRTLAMRQNRTVADYLGALVRKEVEHAERKKAGPRRPTATRRRRAA